MSTEFSAPTSTGQQGGGGDSNLPVSSVGGIFSWYKEINSDQWKAFIAALLGWTLDAMDLLLFAFAVGSIGKVFNLLLAGLYLELYLIT